MKLKKQALTLFLVCALGISGCSKLNETNENFIVGEEKMQTDRKETCAAYEATFVDIDMRAMLESFVEEEKEYSVTDYTQRNEIGQGTVYKRKGKELLELQPPYYHSIHLDEDKEIQITPMVEYDPEHVALYNLEPRMERDAGLLMHYETPYGQCLSNQIDSINILLNEAKLGKEVSFCTPEEAKEKAVQFLGLFDLEVDEDMEIYGVTAQDLIDNTKKSCEVAAIACEDSDFNMEYIEDCYVMKCTMKLDGLSVVNKDDAVLSEGGRTRIIPEITVMYSPHGICYARIEDCIGAGEKVKEQEIVSYDEAVELLKTSYETIISEDVYEFEGGELQYLVIETKDSDGTIFTPVWVFAGKRTYYAGDVELQEDITFMVDAYTGEKVN